jgi:hypothetical protein
MAHSPVHGYIKGVGAARRPTRYMSESEIRRVVSGGRRDGRRSLSAYGSHARGIREHVTAGIGLGPAIARVRWRRGVDQLSGGWTAGVALALVYPLVTQTPRPRTGGAASSTTALPYAGDGKGIGGMKRKPSIASLENVSFDEAAAYLDDAHGDELDAARALAWDRNRLDGSHGAPDEAEVHHALFLLCRARGKQPPSFDEMRVELRRRIAA